MSQLISVIIPVRNGEKYLKEAICSVIKQNMQVEIIVVDDASEDTSAAIACEMGCLVMQHEKCEGPVISKNVGLKAAKGEYVFFLDADDVLREESLSKMFAELEKAPEISAVMAKYQDFISPDLTDEEMYNFNVREDAGYGRLTGTMLIRKEVFEQIGKLDESTTSGESITFLTKTKENGLTVKKMEFISLDRRIHLNNFGRINRQKEFQDYLSIARARIKNGFCNDKN